MMKDVNSKPKLLIIDDDRAVCQSLRLLFLTRGFEVQYIMNPLNVLEFTESFFPDIVILDMNFTLETSGNEGLEILKKLRASFPNLPILLITAWGTLELAVSGMKAGAADFLTKPWQNEEIVSAVQTQLTIRETQQLEQENKLESIVGESLLLKAIRNTILQVSPTHAPVLISGQKGVGKEIVAEAIHDCSLRKDSVFIKLDLNGLSEEQQERQLFGYRRGAFLGAEKDCSGVFRSVGEGTLLLENIDALSWAIQSKLLYVVQEKNFKALGSDDLLKANFRLLCTTKEDLHSMDSFREDLFYKISLVHIEVPSLADCPEDIPMLAKTFVERLNQDEQPTKQINEPALEWLSKQDFPGNTSQLQHLLERAYVLSTSRTLSIQELKKHYSPGLLKNDAFLTLEATEKQLIQKAIALKKGNMSEVAKKLGITRSSLYRRMTKFGISNPNANED